MSRKFGWALASIVALGVAGVGSAQAADLPVKAPPPPPAPVWNWTGFYIGGSVGGIWNDTRADVFPTGCFLNTAPGTGCGGAGPGLSGVAANPIRSDSVRFNDGRFIGGGQAGYNWQAGKWVFGVEGDISWTGINQMIATSKTMTPPLAGFMLHTEAMKQDWLATLRGRAGVTVTPNFLLYATGGLAIAHVQTAGAVAFTVTPDLYGGSNDETRAGWTVGGGGEWMITPNWSVKAEYLFVDLGKQSVNLPCLNTGICGSPPQPAPGASYQTDFHFREHVARVGLNYHFGGPIVAKY
jgi:outer membrane immunogenic protein